MVSDITTDDMQAAPDPYGDPDAPEPGPCWEADTPDDDGADPPYADEPGYGYGV
jgi:hypothetical protein